VRTAASSGNLPAESRRFDDPQNFSPNALMLQHNANDNAPRRSKAAAIFCMNISN
jgi:hypothetical protein